MNILVIGGTGFVGTNLRKFLYLDQMGDDDWIFLGTQSMFVYSRTSGSWVECSNLYGEDWVDKVIEDTQPDVIINLAAIVGGVKFNNENNLHLFEENTYLNTKIIRSARKNGVPKLIQVLSTCAYPDYSDSIAVHPLEEDRMTLSSDSVPESNRGYALSKQIAFEHIGMCREEGLNYTCLAPSNLYGRYDNFSEDSSHFVASLIRKLYYMNDFGDELKMWGDGKPLRQQLFVNDFCDVLKKMVHDERDLDHLYNVAPDENLSIGEFCQKALKSLNMSANIVWSGELSGQFRKDVSNEKIKDWYDIEFTDFEDGFYQTYVWFAYENSNN